MKTGILYLGVGILAISCSVSVTGLDPNAVGQNDGNVDTSPISFKNQIAPIFKQTLNGKTCIQCHTGTPAIGNLNLNESQIGLKGVYDAVSFGRIDEVNPENSKLLTRPMGQTHEKFFEQDDANYKAIVRWVGAGAPFDDVVPTPTPGTKITPTPTVPAADQSFYAKNIYPKLLANCSACHKPGGMFAAFDVTVGNTAVTSCESIKSHKKDQNGAAVNTANAQASTLYTKPTGGVAHQGGALWSTAVEGALIVQWIQQKAASCTTP